MIKDSELQEKIDEVRARTEKSISEFQAHDEFYAYSATHNETKITSTQAYNEIVDNLLPVFKAAKELCETISGDENYFNKRMKHIYHMALVSRMIKTINVHSGTTEDSIESILHSHPHYGGLLYIKNGHINKESELFAEDADRGFKQLMASSLGFSYDDQYTTIYFGAFQDDIHPVYGASDKPKCSVSGNVLNWENMKDSSVFKVALIPLVNREVKRICKENGTPISKYGIHYAQAEQNIQAKINEFCDKKQAQFVKQLQQQTQHELKG